MFNLFGGKMSSDISPVVEAIKNNKKVTFFLGAGVSTSCGIPDFRSPDTGLYANLQRLNLPFPEAVFDLDYFREKPHAFYTLAHELYPGTFAPSKFHHLLRLFQDKGLLQRVYTQNIDTLERLAGIEDHYIVEAHGSFAKNHCIDCSHEMPTKEFKTHLAKGTVNCSKCNGYVKPDIVFFGEALPRRFFEQWDEDAANVEVAIVAGLSLTVHPFASLPSEVNKKSIRLLINKDPAGDLGRRKNDVVVLDDIDKTAQELAEALGWSEELDRLVSKATPKSAEDLAKKVAGEVAEEVTKGSGIDSKTNDEPAKDTKKEGKSETQAQKSEKDVAGDSVADDLAKLKI